MALYSGVTGKISIKIGAGTAKDIAHISNFSVELTREMMEQSSFGEGYKEKVPSIKDWSANSDGAADFATASGQKDLVTAYEAGTACECSFYLDASTFLSATDSSKA